MHEWALLIFTVCMQAAIGGMAMLALYDKRLSALGVEQKYQIMRVPLFVIVGLSIVGLAASFTHLGSPGNAMNTISNIGSSWMSREILVTGFFIGAACVTTGLAIVQKKVNGLLVIVSALLGLVDVYCMGAAYASSLVSGWNSFNTFASFYGTAIVLGPVLAASFIAPRLRNEAQQELGQTLVKNAFFVSLLGIAVQLVGVAVFSSAMPEVSLITGVNAMTTLEPYQGMVAFRWVVEIIGVSVLGYYALAKTQKAPFALAYLALAILLGAEGMSRYVFYVLGA